MSSYYSQERIKECLDYTTYSAIKRAVKSMLKDVPDITILPSENKDEEMFVVIRKKEDKKDGCE